MNEFKELKEILKENLEYIEYYNKEILEYIEYFEIENFLSLIVRMVSLMNDEELIDQICKSKYQTLKEQAVINGTNAIHWKLIDDKDTWIRVAVAEYGTNAIHWKLIDDKDTWIRVAVAEYGNDEMRWKLIDDEDAWVRSAVAEYGSKEMCEILKNDKDEDVRNKAEERLRDLEALFKKIIAKYRTDVKRWRLIDDEDVLIRLAVAKYGSKEMCEILKNDKDEYVRRVAENRLEELEKKRIKESEE